MAEIVIKHQVKKRYVYLIDVLRWPSERDDPYWVPDTWLGPPESFAWPRVRAYLSERAATNRAQQLHGYGCDVVVRRARVESRSERIRRFEW